MTSKILTTLAIVLAVCACNNSGITVSEEYPDIFPDYIGVTIPASIQKLPIRMADGSKCRTSQRQVGDTLWISVTSLGNKNCKGKDNKYNKGDKYNKGNNSSKGDKDNKGNKSYKVRYKEFPIYISRDEIDPYIAYRLIEPGYESWNNMGIYTRALAGFEEKAIVTNEANAKGCVNCHCFDAGSPDRMLFHARGEKGGTVIIDGGSITLNNLKSKGPQRQGTYPAWHPEGRYVAFSSNTTQQCFTMQGDQPVEVYDTESDIILLDTQSEDVKYIINSEDRLETFPGWSEDGSTLYYCEAPSFADVSGQRGEIRYRLMGIKFQDGEPKGEPFVVYQNDSLSISFPRAAGRYILLTGSAFGTFPIWHKEADLYLFDTSTGELTSAETLNSPDTESYHSWSSNRKWVIFSSRRIDGRYTRLFISHFDGNGNFTKPFLLPQKDPNHNTLRLKSYNIPEFVKGDASGKESKIKNLFQ